jgi:cellulose biosynthesis protein BcsQ
MTVLACSLGAYLSTLGKRVALLDLDPKLSASATLLERSVWDQSIIDVLGGSSGGADRGQIWNALQPTDYPNLWVLPGSGELGRVEREMLADAIAEIQPELGSEAFSAIVIDTPSASGPLLGKVIALSDYLLLPFQPDPSSLWAARNSMQALLEYAAEHSPRPFGLVPTFFLADNPLQKKFVQSIESFLRDTNGLAQFAHILTPFPFRPDLSQESHADDLLADSAVEVPSAHKPFVLSSDSLPSLKEIAQAAGFAS